MKEYCKDLKQTVQDETLKSQFELQSKLSKCDMPSYDDFIQNSEGIDQIQSKIDEISEYITKVDDKIQEIVTKYEKRPKTLLQNYESKVRNAQYSEYNPMITPLKIDKAFQSFQNSHRILANQSQNNLNETQNVIMETKLLQKPRVQEYERSDEQEENMISESPLFKITKLDNELKGLMKDQDHQNESEEYHNRLQVNQDFKLQDLDDTELNESSNLNKNITEDSFSYQDHISQNQQLSAADKKIEALQQSFNVSVCIQSKKMDEIQVSTSTAQTSKPKTTTKNSMQTDKHKAFNKNKENNKQISNLDNSNNAGHASVKQNQRESSKSMNRLQQKNQVTKNSKQPSTSKSTANTTTSTQNPKNNSQSHTRISLVDKVKSTNLNKVEETKVKREQTREKSSNNRNISVPRLQLNNVQSDQAKQETFLGFTILNKNLVEVENKQNNFSGLLSPINLKQSDRDISSKLDELYKSYETKEKIFGFGGNSSKQQQQKPSLLNQSLLDDEVLLNDSRDEIRFEENAIDTGRQVQREPDMNKETPLRKNRPQIQSTHIPMEKRSNKRKLDQISNQEEEKGTVPVKQENSKKVKKNPEESQQTPKTEEPSNNKMQRIILWFRNDLRLHDNAILNYAVTKVAKNKQIIPVFCFDPRFYGRKVQKYDTLKTGLVRQRFMIETVQNFRERLEKVGSKLLVSMDKPEIFLPTLIDKSCDNTIVYQDEICSEELTVEKLVKEKCKKAEIKSFWGSSCYHLDDLGFHPNDLPHIYGKFREKTEGVKVRPLFGQPKQDQLPFIEKPSKDILEAAEFMPTLKDFGFSKEEVEKPRDKRACYEFIGGEEQATKRLTEYIFETKSVGNYALVRNNLIGANYSSKLSPWLACGALSPRYIYFQVKEFEKKHRTNESTKVFLDELFWRDFYRFWCMKYGSKVFSSYGIYNREYYDWTTDKETVKKWKEGNTGMPIIDALMREMNVTGFMPNRGRMIVACYLTMDLKQDWREGAYHFEEKLIDHDVQSNYGGWNFSAGIGPGRVLVFNSVKQSKDHDKNGDYIKMWVPELKKVPVEYIHEPWTMPKDLQKGCKTVIGEDYPFPINCSKYTNKVAHTIEKQAKKSKRAEEKLKQTKLTK